MATVQTTYSQTMPVGIVGQKVDGQEWNAITRVCETAAGIDFGKPVMRGAADLGCIAATAALAATNFLGISVRDVTIRPSAGNKYPQYGNVTIVSMGSIWGKVGEAVTAGQDALYDTATGVYMRTAGAGRVALPGWEFDSTALAILVRRKD
jgi:hypothetical protein